MKLMKNTSNRCIQIRIADNQSISPAQLYNNTNRHRIFDHLHTQPQCYVIPQCSCSFNNIIGCFSITKVTRYYSLLVADCGLIKNKEVSAQLITEHVAMKFNEIHKASASSRVMLKVVLEITCLALSSMRVKHKKVLQNLAFSHRHRKR